MYALRRHIMVSKYNSFCKTVQHMHNQSNHICAHSSKNKFNVVNPATGKIVGEVLDMDVKDAQVAIDLSTQAFKTWKETTAKDRSHFLRKWYNVLVENQDYLAEIVTLEAGKPLAEARGEVAYGNSFVEFFSEEARHIRGEIIPSPISTKKIFVEKHPIGVVALITPWNFPHAMITRKAAAALASGCACVIKPAEDTPLTAIALIELADKAGLPKGLLNVVTCDRGNAASVGKLFCESPAVAGISFTGSTQVGKILYQQCASGIKRLGLELGGNAPFIVYESANLDQAVQGALQSKFRNCGQTCVAANRFIVQESIYQEFVEKFVNEIKALKIGNGANAGINLGPLINKAQLEKISNIVEDAVTKGATLLHGGKALPDLGELFYEPTVITNTNANMKIFTEEVFGPIVNVISFQDEDESLQIANGTERGLAGYFYSQDIAQIFRVSKNLEVGMCGVNEGLISTAEAPFGGIKESGLGREGSHHGIDDFTYIKYVCLGNL